METFEIHITGSPQIFLELDRLKIRSLVIELLKPDREVFRTQCMSSTVQQFKNLSEAIKWTEGLSDMLESKGVEIFRKKIESPFYKHYINKALYLETHWKVDGFIEKFIPLSRIGHKIVATKRAYDNEMFYDLRHRANELGSEVEMCLYDTAINEDFDWFKLYE